MGNDSSHRGQRVAGTPSETPGQRFDQEFSHENEAKTTHETTNENPRETHRENSRASLRAIARTHLRRGRCSRAEHGAGELAQLELFSDEHGTPDLFGPAGGEVA